ncbi:MAG: PilX N-terminal domain-containing pilus assembly protein, partial [Acinetobacter sp.]
MRISYRQQRGATLIVVLILLLIITVIGIFAIRTAMTSLNIATNSQISQ